jgi:hypothetical protein
MLKDEIEKKYKLKNKTKKTDLSQLGLTCQTYVPSHETKITS